MCGRDDGGRAARAATVTLWECNTRRESREGPLGLSFVCGGGGGGGVEGAVADEM